MIDMLLRLSSRERGLLALLAGGIVPLAVIFGLLLPLAERRDAAHQALDEARALQAWVIARAGEHGTLLAQTGPGSAAPGAPIGSAGIEQSLIAAQLRRDVSELGSRSAGEIEIGFDAVDFTRLANWLSDNHPGWGYAIDSFRIESLETSGRVSARMTLRPVGN